MKPRLALSAFTLLLAASFARPASGQGCADVLVVVDNSGGMSFEASLVQDELNGFASLVTGLGIDLRVILVSADSTDASGICVPPPLGSGSCPADENRPRFHHYATAVPSGQVFGTILSTHPAWSRSLRHGASRTVILVTDDDDDLAWTTFRDQLVALEPSFQGFRAHAIVAEHDPSVPGPCLGLANAVGTEYIGLAAATGGTNEDLCAQIFTPFFQSFASAVITDAGVCPVRPAPPPAGGVLDGPTLPLGTTGLRVETPRLGTPLRVWVDTSATPRARYSLVVAGLGISQVTLRSIQPSKGSADLHTIPIPSDPALVGRAFWLRPIVAGDRLDVGAVFEVRIGGS